MFSSAGRVAGERRQRRVDNECWPSLRKLPLVRRLSKHVYHVVVLSAPNWYASWRATLDFDTIRYGVGGVELFRPENLPQGQVGFAVGTDGKSLVGVGPGDWRPEWVVIGHETACGDPIFTSEESLHPVFSAMHGKAPGSLNWSHPHLTRSAIASLSFDDLQVTEAVPWNSTQIRQQWRNRRSSFKTSETLLTVTQRRSTFGLFRSRLTWSLTKASHPSEVHHFKLGDSVPKPLGFIALRQNGRGAGRHTPPSPFRPLSRRSGRIPALPYPPPRRAQYKLTRPIRKNQLQKSLRARYKYLVLDLRWPVLK
jgi:hypothetical protein